MRPFPKIIVVGFGVAGFIYFWGLALGPGLNYPYLQLEKIYDDLTSSPHEIAKFECSDGFMWVLKTSDIIVQGNMLELQQPSVILRHINVLYLMRQANAVALFYVYQTDPSANPVRAEVLDNNAELPEHANCLKAAASLNPVFYPYWENWGFDGHIPWLRIFGVS